MTSEVSTYSFMPKMSYVMRSSPQWIRASGTRRWKWLRSLNQESALPSQRRRPPRNRKALQLWLSSKPIKRNTALK